MWTETFRCLDFEKAEEPEIKLPTFVGTISKAREFQKNITFSFVDYAKTFNCVDYNKLWKIFKEMEIPVHLTCLLRNLYAHQGTTDWFQIKKEEVDVFLELSSFFSDSTDVDNLISGSSTFSKSSLNFWNFMVHVLLKPGLENFEHYFASMWDGCNCAVVWTFFGIAFLGLKWKLTFPSPVATAEFSKFAGILSASLSQHHLLGFEIAQLESRHLH